MEVIKLLEPSACPGIAQIITLRQATDQVLKAKKQANLRPKYIDSLRQYLNQFMRGREDVPISAIDLAALQTWFDVRKESAVARASNIGRLSSLFGYSVKQGWIKDNPCKRLETPHIDRKPPGILSIDDASKLTTALSGEFRDLIGYVTPVCFGGLRPNESAQLRLSEIKGALIEVTPETCKTRQRRFVPINDTLAAWLAVPGLKLGSDFAPITLRRRLARLKSSLEPFAWPHDVLRHSFCSYALPKFGAGKTAEWAGHSEQILFTHYRERVKPADVEAYWGLRPTTS